VLVHLRALLVVRAATAIRVLEASLQVVVRLLADLARFAIILRGQAFIGFVREGRGCIDGMLAFELTALIRRAGSRGFVVGWLALLRHCNLGTFI
jgi:hypothetical protein